MCIRDSGKGEETESPLNETFDVGLFSAEPGKGAFDRGAVMLMERRPLRLSLIHI